MGTMSRYDPAAVRGRGRAPSYIWTGYQQGVTRRAFRPRGLKPNWHLILTTAGRGSFLQPGVRLPLEPGDLILFAPDCYQDYGAEPGQSWDDIFIHFSPRPNWHPWMRWPRVGNGLFHVHLREGEVRDRVRDAMLRCHHYAHASFSTIAHELALNAVEEALLLGIHEAIYPVGPAGDDERGRRSPAIARAVEAIASDLRRRLSIRSLARIAGLSPSHFAHRFKEEIGEPVLAYVNRLRIREAARLLEAEGMNVTEVAESLGYSSPFYFSRQFRRFYFLSPSDFRRNTASLQWASTARRRTGGSDPPAPAGSRARSPDR
jgi:AraC family transcriptional regulator of arabinose operon